jgi:4-amino-4-deoxy-L-arabinose transferase-like glycosyltransferase
MSPHLVKLPKYLVLALLLYAPIFGYLDALPIRVWDEARIAINAQEMCENGDYIVTRYHGEPDMWNTKPPMLVWMQVFWMKLLGAGELAIRLPSALAALFTCLALLVFCMRYFKSYWLGFISVLLLITSNGYVNIHIARTGDYDALLTLFTTLGCLFFFAASETRQTKYIYLFFTALTCAALTKGVAGLLVTPALGLYCLLRRQLRFFLTNKHFYTGLFSMLFIAVGYYFLRDAKNPGYLAAIQDNELYGRFLDPNGAAAATTFDFWFYFNNLINLKLPDRYLLIPCGLLIGLASKDERIRRFTLFLLLVTLTFFLVISSSRSKLHWYDAPMYPFYALIMALFLHFIFDWLKNSPWTAKTLGANVLPFVFLFLVFIRPYHDVFMRNYESKEEPWDSEFYHIEYYLRSTVRGEADIKGMDLVYQGYDAPTLFYLNILKERGVTVNYRQMHELKERDVVIACEDTVKNYLRNHYRYEERQAVGAVFIYTITGR